MKQCGNRQEASDNTVVTMHVDDRHEISQLLELTITQIDMALKEADHSIIELIGAMTAMTGSVQRIGQKLDELPQSPKVASLADDIESNCRQAESSMQQAVTAFQFYDRLSQRFQHINENLNAVNNVIKAPDQQHPVLWQSLHEKVRSIYTLEQTQYMQQSLVNRVSAGLDDNPSADQAVADKQESSGDIELF